MVAGVRRNQTILVAIHYSRLKAFPVGNGRLTVSQFVGRHLFQTYIKTQLAHRGHIGTELDGSILVPARYMSTHSLGREELRESPLDISTFYRIGIVAAPEFGEVFQRLIIATGTTTGTKHHRNIRIIFLHAFHHIIHTTYMVDIQIALFFLQIRRVDIGNRAVTIPLEECDVRIFLHQFFYYTVNIILYFRIAQIEYQLVTVIITVSIFIVDSPVRMFLEQFTFRIHHFRFNPDTEFYTSFLSCVYQCRNTARQFTVSYFPVTQSGLVILTWIFVGKPTVVQQEHIYTQVFGFLHQACQLLLVEIETGILPVVQQCQAAAFTVLQAIITRPIMQVTAPL